MHRAPWCAPAGTGSPSAPPHTLAPSSRSIVNRFSASKVREQLRHGEKKNGGWKVCQRRTPKVKEKVRNPPRPWQRSLCFIPVRARRLASCRAYMGEPERVATRPIIAARNRKNGLMIIFPSISLQACLPSCHIPIDHTFDVVRPSGMAISLAIYVFGVVYFIINQNIIKK